VSGPSIRTRSRIRPDDLLSYNVFSISEQDLEEVRRLQREFFRAVRALAARSAPTDAAALLLVQSIAWHPEVASGYE